MQLFTEHGTPRIHSRRYRRKPLTGSCEVCSEPCDKDSRWCWAHWLEARNLREAEVRYAKDLTQRIARAEKRLKRAMRSLPKTAQCKHCDKKFVPRLSDYAGRSFCSHAHYRKHWKQTRKHWERQRSGSKTRVYRARILKRDDERCFCGSRVRLDVEVPHPLAFTLDHIIPLAQGGEHCPSNVRVAHFKCNTERGARGGDEQLFLVG